MQTGSFQVNVIDHPALKIHLAKMRDINTSCETFRQEMHAASRLMAVYASANFSVQTTTITTPLEQTDGHVWQHPLVFVPILRAGLGMLQGFMEIIPSANIGHMGLRRNEETLAPEQYYANIPASIADAEVVMLDPMLATGGSAVYALDCLKKAGAKKITFCCLFAAPEGIECVSKAHPDVQIHAASLDRQLNEKGYIMPGLGDAGDRYFGTL